MIAKGEFEIANHTVQAGIWLEDDDYSRFTRRVNHVGGLQSGAVLFNEVNYYWRNFDSARETLQVFVKDTISLLDLCERELQPVVGSLKHVIEGKDAMMGSVRSLARNHLA